MCRITTAAWMSTALRNRAALSARLRMHAQGKDARRTPCTPEAFSAVRRTQVAARKRELKAYLSGRRNRLTLHRNFKLP
jgi:hypothetical protein